MGNVGELRPVPTFDRHYAVMRNNSFPYLYTTSYISVDLALLEASPLRGVNAVVRCRSVVNL